MLLVLDDDPTGSQTVAGVPLLLRFDDADVAWALDDGGDVVFALTNSRALPERDAVALTRSVTRSVASAALARGRDVRVLSRGDSTLRGHFPAEVDALVAGLGDVGHDPPDAILLCPAYPEAGRVTIDGVHLLRDGDGRLVPVAETEFARDPVFAYGESDLREWAARRCGISPSEVGHVALGEIRAGGAARVAELLRDARGGRVVALDAETRADLDVLAAGIVAAERAGRRFVYRTAPSFVAARAGRAPAPPLHTLPAADVAVRPGGGGLVVVGSHTDLTTRQLDAAVAAHGLTVVELSVAALVDPGLRAAELIRVAEAAQRALERGDVALATSREVVVGGSAAESAAVKGRIAAALVDAVVSIVSACVPRWVVAKGGITSHDVAAAALEAGRATVLGQLFPGQVSVWRLEDGPYEGLPYVVFPGNVGGVETLAAALARLGAGALESHSEVIGEPVDL
ncbi:four-carbon acid sugar kinase family protein [Conexibacter woesei]|uniref:Type III effector Hrp-dependent outers n=1 Tax=Conexibacter woesei (strain DSM 14684 / CCUG 47730 / CIP 108061 / JCM 11494 / NBRC 100937 / ID131577) TaxID=469383 RepID=D3EZ09_CONWI|nr:four-carbon acid sugar kinase family protein [Conexibacter woesei]ADB49883.1 type III effector Hrp-dependent outers [Conexibacter woesei DSM 14684]